ncbi:MAG: T9SS type A sorting domain-containing protein [Prolixibacteraceae bacterium]|jgi:hypothetical protein
MKKIYTSFWFCLVFFSGIAQTLDWAYSLKSNTVQDQIYDISSNGTDRFAIFGLDTQNLDVINGSAEFNNSGKFLAVYNEKAEIQWKQSMYQLSLGIKMNSANEVFVTGSFGGTVDFDPSGNVFNLTGEGTNCFLQKFAADGTFLWAANAQTGGGGSEIEQLADGRIVISGRSDMAGNVTLSDNSTVDLPKGVFLLEFSADGKLQNAYSISVPDAAGYGYVYNLASDASNNIYICGTLDGVADFDLKAGLSNNSQTHAYDAFLAKYDSNFNLKWYKVFGDQNVSPFGWDKAHSMAVDPSGNLFVGGEFTWTTDFDPVANKGKTQLISDTRTQAPSGFIMQYASDGTLNWVKEIGAPNQDTGKFGENRVRGIQLQGNTLYAWIENTKYCDADPSEAEKIYTSTGASNLIFASYSVDGELQNSFMIDAALNYTISAGIEMLGNDSFVTSGTFQKETDFDPTPETMLLKTNPAGAFYWADLDTYMAKYNFGTPTKTQNFALVEEIQVFPNPFQSEIRIKSVIGKSVRHIRLFSVDGKLTFEAYNPNNQVSVLNLKSGIYIYELVFDDNSVAYGKIVKQ